MSSKFQRIREMFLLWHFITMLGVSGGTGETCYSPVYLELNKTGTLHCSFSGGFHSLVWYGTVDISGEPAIIARDESGEINGPGYSSGEHDIHPNGSLIIRNVSIEHETTFTVTLFRSSQQLPQLYQVQVKTFVNPLQNRPVVPSCEDALGSCYIEWTQSTNVSCQIEHSRPAINISWTHRTSSRDNIVLSIDASSNDATTHTTAVMLQDPSMYQTNLSLYVCKADDPIGLLERNETTVLLERKNIDWSSIPVIKILRERYSNVNMACAQRSPQIVVWKKGESVNDLVTRVYGVLFEDDFRSPVPDRWKLEADSSLTIQEVQITDESMYACHSYDGRMEAFDVYELKVNVYPSPAYPVIEGCPSDRYCVLVKNSSDTITCTVRGIRPVVDLKLQSFPPGSPEVSIIDTLRTVWVNNDLTDVILTAKLDFRKTSSTRHTLECIVTGENAWMFSELSTKFDVILTDIHPTKTPSVIQSSNQPLYYIIMVVVFVVLLVPLASITICCLIVTRRRWRHTRHEEHRQRNDQEYKEVDPEEDELGEMYKTWTTPEKERLKKPTHHQCNSISTPQA